MKKLLILTLLSNVLYSSPQLNLEDLAHGKELTTDEQAELGSALLLYQLALKNKRENLFNKDDLCIHFPKKNMKGNTSNQKYKMTLILSNSSYKIGEAGQYSNNSDAKRKRDKLTNVLDIFGDFFAGTKTTPKITVNGYADGLKNDKKEFSTESLNTSQYIDTESKARNYDLSKKRAEDGKSIINSSKLKSNVIQEQGYISSSLEDQGFKRCDSRRATTIDLEYSPSVELVSEDGSFIPTFNMATKEEADQMTISSAMDMLEKIKENNGSVDQAYKSLPKACQNPSSREVLNKMKSAHDAFIENLEKNFISKESTILHNSRPKLNQVKAAYPQLKIKSPKRIHYSLYKIHNRIKQEKSQGKLRKLKEKEQFILNLITLDKSNISPSDLYDSLKAEDKAASPASLFGQTNKYTKSILKGLHSGGIKQSTHALDCFSTKEFLKRQDPSKYSTPVKDFIDKDGNLKVSFNSYNMPEHGHICTKCHTGSHPDGSTKTRYEMATPTEKKSSSYASGLRDSKMTLNAAKNQKLDPYSIGSSKIRTIQIVKDCKYSASGKGFDPEYLKQNSITHSLDNFQTGEVIKNIGKNDCIYTKDIMPGCEIDPEGEGKGKELNKARKEFSFYHFDKKYVKILIEDQVDPVLAAINKINAIGNQCQDVSESDKDTISNAQELIDGLMCPEDKVPEPKHDAECK